MSDLKQVHPLQEYLNIQQTRISEFAKNYPDIWRVFETCFAISGALRSAIGRQKAITKMEVFRLLMWHSVTNYQVQSLILILNHELDSGYALLRLATELSRDVFCVGDDETRLNLWLERENRKGEYQDIFRFEETFFGKAAHTIYRFCSKFGVHGHMTDSMFSEPVGLSADSAFVLLDVSELGILDAVHVWLTAFAPLQHLCASTFFEHYFLDLQGIIADFASFEIMMADVASDLGKSLNQLRQKT